MEGPTVKVKRCRVKLRGGGFPRKERLQEGFLDRDTSGKVSQVAGKGVVPVFQGNKQSNI